jgi:hypothetical protein
VIPSLPSLAQAVTDPRVAPLDLKVLLALALELDTQEFRPVKELALRRSLGMGRTRLYQGLVMLVGLHYLERRAGAPGQVWEYRLPYSVRAGERTDAA